MRVAWHLGEIVQEVAGLPVAGLLPSRTVLVPSPFVAIALRREILAAGRADLLVGTRFTTAPLFGEEILRIARVGFVPGEETRRSERVLAVLRSQISLRYFPNDLFRRTPGWETAFARTIGELEDAGLDPSAFGDAATNDRERDIADVWRAVDVAARTSWTSERILREAAVAAKPNASVVSIITGEESANHAAFLEALGARVTWLAARPIDGSFNERLAARWRLEDARQPAPNDDEPTRRARIASRIFAPESARSPIGDDGTVIIEECAGIDDEMEAAVDWVAREVLTSATPIGSLAILVPRSDPFAWMLADRIGRLPWGVDPPVFLASGRPIAQTGAGARALAVFGCLRDGMRAASLSRLLPALRAPIGQRASLSRKQALQVVTGLGMLGGRSLNPEHASEWLQNLDERVPDLERRIARPVSGPRESKDRDSDIELLELFRAARPALEALSGIASMLANRLDDGAVLANRLLDFLRTWLLSPGERGHVADLLGPFFVDVTAEGIGASLRGVEALDALATAAREARLVEGRYGEPRIFIGTIEQATGLSFDAVRVLGLTEGGLPAALHEDPVLPDFLRRAFKHPLPLRADRAGAELRAFHRLTLHTRHRLALSIPRSSFEGTEKEPSFVVLEVVRAIEGRMPSVAALRAHAFLAARRIRDDHRLRAGVGDGVRLDRAGKLRRVPSSWPAIDSSHEPLAQVRSLRVPGLTPERPLTGHGLARLLECPYRFLHEFVLGYGTPEDLLDPSDPDPTWYGTLFHRAVETLSRGSIWTEEEGRACAARVFEDLARWRPLDEGARETYLARLQRDVAAFVRSESGANRLIDVERPFGWDAPVELAVGARRVFVRGFIDRLDETDGVTLVRDLKTGTPRLRVGREANPTPVRDAQIALYARVIERLASDWNVPRVVAAAYVYAGPWGVAQRSFRDDTDRLLTASLDWLEAALDLLEAGTFPRTPREDDCLWCPFDALCDAPARVRDAEIDVPSLLRFRALKSAGGEGS